jgi:ABC-type multidrug transport system fused ATPase/permease subunit
MDDYPLLGVMLTMFSFFLFMAWIFCLFYIFRDVFRSRDLSGFAKAGWVFLIVLLPLIGVLAYLISRGSSMQQRDAQEAAERERALQEYIRNVAATPPAAAATETPTAAPAAPAAPAHAK